MTGYTIKGDLVIFDDAPPAGEQVIAMSQHNWDMHVAHLWMTERRPQPMTYNMSADQIAQRDRKVSRQERRQNERLARKGRA